MTEPATNPDRPDVDADKEARLHLFMSGYKSGYGTALLRGMEAGGIPPAPALVDMLAHEAAMQVMNDPAARHDISEMIEAALADPANAPTGGRLFKVHSPGCRCGR